MFVIIFRFKEKVSPPTHQSIDPTFQLNFLICVHEKSKYLYAKPDTEFLVNERKSNEKETDKIYRLCMFLSLSI